MKTRIVDVFHTWKNAGWAGENGCLNNVVRSVGAIRRAPTSDERSWLLGAADRSGGLCRASLIGGPSLSHQFAALVDATATPALGGVAHAQQAYSPGTVSPGQPP